MNKEQIKKNIDEATRVFRETLEMTYLKDGGRPLYGVGVHTLTHLFTGKVSIHRKSNGALRISGELPKDMFVDDCKLLPQGLSDWKIFPLVITLFHEEGDVE